MLEPTEYEVLWAAETSLRALEKGRNSYLCPELNPSASVFQPRVLSLYWMKCRGSKAANISVN
jgi:hypothetical protein